ncbi:hypothetical protein [Pseudomonas sp. B14(2017)]|uniref:hypothetical protein n=1 Tax=Pseudomonas sp. B14(2017) TaxID=1981745 RepID=UPI000A20133C|nr:hypothetical protein [Pseudomonas sp. B14(2017)]
MVTRAALEAAFDLLGNLQSRGVRCIIAGGCARDIFFGVKPKDIDIITAGADFTKVMIALDHFNVPFTIQPFYDTNESDRVKGCFKIQNLPVDVIVYDYDCVTEAVDNFDYNLNQFAVVEAHHGVEGAYVRFLGEKHWGKLEVVRRIYPESRAAARYQKMRDKYIDLIPRRATGEELPVTCPVGGQDAPF